jgi:probable rRNA maturation factor
MLEIRKTSLGPMPPIPFEKLARAALPSRYELSLVICGDALAQEMNETYRKKRYAPNVLSFPLTKTEGEIFLNAPRAKREAKLYGMSFSDRLAHLFVHGCLHLKGLAHGRIMDSNERRILRRFGFEWHNESTQGSTSAPTTSK